MVLENVCTVDFSPSCLRYMKKENFQPEKLRTLKFMIQVTQMALGTADLLWHLFICQSWEFHFFFFFFF